ncbi:MAG: thiamine phosphate synthase [Blastocatellia bacterium]
MLPKWNNQSGTPLLYLITDRQQFKTSATPAQLSAQLEAITHAAAAGCQLIQVREKDLSSRELCAFVRAALAAIRPFGAKLLVNDRLDVALATGADGIHLRVNSLPVAEVRQLVPPDFLVGASTHSLAEAQAAAAGGADFLVCGPVFFTPSKASYGPPLGLERFGEICQRVKLPVLALGGITMNNFADCLAQRAAGVAAISLFNHPATLGTNIKMMLSSRCLPTR